MANETYTIDKSDRFKKSINSILADLAIEHELTNGIAILLDGASAMSSKFFRSAGFRRKSLWVPNDCIDTVKVLLRTNLCRVFYKTLVELLVSPTCLKNRRRVTLAYFDGCGTFFGNQSRGTSLKRDIETYFREEYPAQKSIFAYSVMRNRQRGQTRDQANDLTKELIERCCRQYNLQATLIDEDRHRNMVAWGIFIIERI